MVRPAYVADPTSDSAGMFVVPRRCPGPHLRQAIIRPIDRTGPEVPYDDRRDVEVLESGYVTLIK